MTRGRRTRAPVIALFAIGPGKTKNKTKENPITQRSMPTSLWAVF
jgi:hypothetical protein